MDGYKIRAKLALTFPKAVNNTEADEIMMQYARAFATAVECELSNGDLPFEEQELFQRLTETVSALPKKNVRLIGLHVWHKGAVSSGSMLAVKPEGGAPGGSPTVPAMPAVSQTREKPMSSGAAHTATTVKPPEKAPPSSAGAPQRPSMSSQPAAPAASRPAATPVARAAVAPSSSAVPGSPPSSRVTMPAMPAQRPNAPTPGIPSRPAANPGVSGTRYSAGSARATTTPGVVNKPVVAPATAASPAQSSAAARMASGVVPAVDPRIVRSKSGFSLALENSQGDTAEDLGRGLAQPIRDAAADVLFGTLGALHGSLSDPLSLLDGRCDEELRRSLVGEACVYVCYVLYEALTRTSLPQMQSILVVQGACIHALMDQNMPVSELSRYLATESPREEFSGRVCTLFGVRETPEMQQRVEAHLRSLRLDVRSCIEQIEQRLLRAKALSEQKTG
jgi:hypothetical protein